MRDRALFKIKRQVLQGPWGLDSHLHAHWGCCGGIRGIRKLADAASCRPWAGMPAAFTLRRCIVSDIKQQAIPACEKVHPGGVVSSQKGTSWNEWSALAQQRKAGETQPVSSIKCSVCEHERNDVNGATEVVAGDCKSP